MRGFPTAGQVFGDYLIERELGRGAMGIVYLAHQLRPPRPVALKVMSPALDDPAFRKRFEREGRILGQLQSAYIVTVLEYGEHDGWLYLTNPYLEAGDLHRRIQSAPLEPAKALRLLGQLATGLAAAHQQGIVHRDIKPSNILLAEEADGLRALLADFGIARDHQLDSTLTGSAVVGTLAYMPPERHFGAAATPAGDVYALGCVLWAMLHRRPPHVDASGRLNIPDLVSGAQAAYCGPLAGTVNAVLERCLAPDPRDRYADAGQLRVALADEAARRPFQGPWPEPARWDVHARRTMPDLGREPEAEPERPRDPDPEPAVDRNLHADTTVKGDLPDHLERGPETSSGSSGSSRKVIVGAVLAALAVALVATLLVVLVTREDDPQRATDPGTDTSTDAEATITPAPPPPSTTFEPQDEPDLGPLTTAPFSGTCHRLTADGLAADSDSGLGVPCAIEHTTVTVGVLEVAATGPLSRFDDRAAECWNSAIRFLGGGPEATLGSALSVVYFLPTQEEQLEGASWVRCDVVTYLNDRVFPLPESVTASGFRSGRIERAVAECARQDGTVVVCSQPHAYEVVAVPRVSRGQYAAAGGRVPPSGDPLPFPQQSVVNGLEGRCPERTEWYYPVAEGAWKAGLPYLVCLG